MTNPVEAVIASLGLDPHRARDAAMRAASAPGHSVSHSRDLDRIQALPRRDWRVGLGRRFGNTEDLRAAMTAAFRRRAKDDAGKPVELRAVQAAALAEAHDFGGALAPIKVGGGKTLITLLAAVVLGARRALLLVPAEHRDKTLRDWERYGRDWVLPAIVVGDERRGDHAVELRVESYSRLSRAGSPAIEVRVGEGGRLIDQRGEVLRASESLLRRAGVDRARWRELLGGEGTPGEHLGTIPARPGGDELLEAWSPDLLIADEAHRLANTRAGVTRKVRRYLEASGARAIFLSGTLIKRSVRELGHLGKWALGDISPVPHDRGALLEWAGALDEPRGGGTRVQVGALARLCGPEDQDNLRRDPVTTVRRAFGRRLVETPGVVAARGGGCEASLTIRARHVLVDEVGVVAAIKDLRNRWQLPDGQPIADAAQLAEHLRNLACGFWYRWVEQPSDDWRDARREWCQLVRRVTQRGRRGLDTELQVARACAAGRIEDGGAWARWRDVRDQFKPETEAVWCGDQVVQDAARWLAKTGGIAWVSRRALGERLAEIAGVPFFRRRGRDASGAFVEDASGPAVCSTNTCAEGVNLQYKWRQSYVVQPLVSASRTEQLLGRTHREGQEADEVRCEICVASPEQLEAFESALVGAAELQDKLCEPQKLCYADVDVGPGEGPLW